ncbi:hypothetical protein R5R35_010895 [Gryllus longicercus]|uniref:Crossover junction endonuclease EME1 n=1 Tax=Gryllus longicercus TaxID=2509291 RepID=A0AAN9VJG6_9ORTH
MEVVILSSDSSSPPSPIANSPGSNKSTEPDGANIAEKRDFLIKSTVNKIPIHNFSSSDESDNECSPVLENKNSCESVVKITENDGDFEFYQIEETYTQRGYVSQVKEDLINVEVLNNSDDKYSAQESKTSKKKSLQEERERRLKEKEEKMVEKAREKALKKAASEAQKANRPGECMKHIQVLIDQRLLTEEYSGNLLSALQAGQIQYSIQEQLSEKIITWVKTVYSYHCDDDGKVISSTNLKEENIVLIIMMSNQLTQLVREMKLRSYIQNIAKQHLKKRLILIIYKLGEYYRLQNIEKQRKFKTQCRTGSGAKEKQNVENQVCQSDIEKALIEIQIFENCSHRFVETSQDFGTLIAQFTKALAEKEFKLEKQKKEQENLGWFASGDSRDTVKVDKSGNGLLRLWKQQLCQFNTASLDTAEAIVSLYPSPKSLIQAYENCLTPRQGQLLLQDIAVRRCAGPLTSVRRVGPELSKKIYNFFTSKNGELSLSQDSKDT